MQVKIRKVTKEDLSTVGKIWASAFNDAYKWEHWSNENGVKIVSYMYEKQPDLFFLAEVDGEIVGATWGAIKPHLDGNHMVDGAVFISPKHQGRGLYRKLSLVRLKEATEKYKITGIQILASKADEFPVSFYKRLGFKETSWVLLYTKPQKLLEELQKTE